MTKKKKFEGVNAFYKGRELTLNAFKSRIFPLKFSQGKELKICFKDYQ